MAKDHATYSFGPYQLRAQSRELFKLGTKLRLRPQAYQVLLVLLERADEAVPREELQRALWPAAIATDFELGLNTCIKELRSVLSDSATEPRYIETLPRVGYRMIHAVTVQELARGEDDLVPAGNPLVAESVPAPIQVQETQSKKKSSIRHWPIAAGLTLVVGLAAMAAYLRWAPSRNHPQTPAARTMLAVLPFANLTGDPNQDYFSEGLTEEMITQLGRLDPQHLGLIARSSAIRFKNDRRDLSEIGKQLGVQYVLEGSVRREAGKVRITAELIHAVDQTHLWSQEYDRESASILAVQSEIAKEIAREIKITLRPGESPDKVRSATLSPNAYAAYDLYLEGRYFWNKRTPQGLERAAEYFQQSIEKDPTYARSYAGLADTYALISGYATILPDISIPKARAAAQSAIQLDGGLAEAHVSLAVIAQNYDWDWSTAEKEYRRAIELDPNYATAHHWYAEYLALNGRFEEAFAEIERARQLDPLSLIIAADRGVILYFSRQNESASAQFRSVLEMEPDFPRAHMIVFAYVQQGKYREALTEFDRWGKNDANPWTSMLGVYVLGRSGQREQAQRELQKLSHLNWQQNPVSVAVAYIGLGNKDQAFVWLENAYAQHATSLTALKVDPTYDPLRGDPRFNELLRRMGLEP